MLTYKPKQCIYIYRYINILEAHRAPSMGFHTRSDVIMGLFGKKKKEEIKAPSCACSCGCADEKATESKNKCFAKAAEGIFCVKVLGAGCASCHKQYEYAKDSGWIFITARQKNHPYENLYAINEKEPEKSSLILENPAKAADVFSNLCYLPEFVLMKKKLRLIFLLMMEKAVIW